MINLETVAKKLENILNGKDTETIGIEIDPELSGFQFQVATSGYHLDDIADMATGKNFIPVFLGQAGGEYEPIKHMKKAIYSMPVSIYYPVRFKDKFFAINEFLQETLVGSVLDYGGNVGKCLSTITVAQYGELQDIDLREFANWVENTYKQRIGMTEMYMSMSFNIMLQTTDQQSMLYGNQVEYGLRFKYNGTWYPEETSTSYEPIMWSMQSSSISTSPISQQLIGGNYATNVVNITSRNRAFSAYPKNTAIWNTIRDIYNEGKINLIEEAKLIKKYGTVASYTSNVVITEIVENVEYGDLISYTIILGDR